MMYRRCCLARFGYNGVDNGFLRFRYVCIRALPPVVDMDCGSRPATSLACASYIGNLPLFSW